MTKLVTFVCAIGAVAIAVTISPIIMALVGAFSGWVVGWFFSETILGFFAALGIKGLAMWQIGLSLGFIGGFFKETRAVKSS